MSTTLVTIPPEDAWLIARLSRIVANRLIEVADPPAARRSLLRALFGLQRLPILIPDLQVSLCAGHQQVLLDAEQLSFFSYTEDWHTEFRIQYFEGSSHCIEGLDMLGGSARRDAATLRLDGFEEAMAEADELSIEDLSTPGMVDEPPIDDYLEYAQTYDTP